MIVNALLTLLILGFVPAIILICVRIDRRRQGHVASVLEPLGFHVDNAPNEEVRAIAMEGIGATVAPTTRGITWLATGTIGGLEAVVFEHRYFEAAGNWIETHLCAWVAAPIEVPEIYLTRIGMKRRAAEPDTDPLTDPLGTAWTMRTDDEVSANLTLTPDIHNAIMSGESVVMWRIGGGVIAAVSPPGASIQTLADMLTRIDLLAEQLTK